MKNYYVTEITKGDSKVKGTSVYEFDTLDKAEASFHSKLGTAMKSELYEEEVIYVTDSDCILYPHLSKHYIRPVPITEAVTEE